MKYDIFKHGIGTKILNIKTGQVGIVEDIRETFHEYIEPFVRYEGNKELVRENKYDMEVIKEEN